MFEYSYRNIFFRAKARYFSLQKIKCPALSNEMVYFSREGFEHLIRKGRRLRSISDQTRRLYLFTHASVIIEKGVVCDYRFVIKETKNGNKKIHFWTLSHNIAERTIKVVLIQHADGKKLFLSIM